MRGLKNTIIIVLILAVTGGGGWFAYNKLYPLCDVKMKFVAGQRWHSTTIVTMNAGAIQGDIVMKSDLTVSKVTKDGTGLVVERITEANSSIPMLNSMFGALKGKRLVQNIYPDGKKEILTALPPGLENISNSTTDGYPKKPMRKGAKWTDAKTANGITTNGEYQIIREEMVKGNKCLRVKTVVKNSGGGNDTTATGFIWIDIESDWVLRS